MSIMVIWLLYDVNQVLLKIQKTDAGVIRELHLSFIRTLANYHIS